MSVVAVFPLGLLQYCQPEGRPLCRPFASGFAKHTLTPAAAPKSSSRPCGNVDVSAQVFKKKRQRKVLFEVDSTETLEAIQSVLCVRIVDFEWPEVCGFRVPFVVCPRRFGFACGVWYVRCKLSSLCAFGVCVSELHKTAKARCSR